MISMEIVGRGKRGGCCGGFVRFLNYVGHGETIVCNTEGGIGVPKIRVATFLDGWANCIR